MPAGVLPREKQPQPQRPAVSMTPQAIQQRLIVANQELARHNGKLRAEVFESRRRADMAVNAEKQAAIVNAILRQQNDNAVRETRRILAKLSSSNDEITRLKIRLAAHDREREQHDRERPRIPPSSPEPKPKPEQEPEPTPRRHRRATKVLEAPTAAATPVRSTRIDVADDPDDVWAFIEEEQREFPRAPVPATPANTPVATLQPKSFNPTALWADSENLVPPARPRHQGTPQVAARVGLRERAKNVSYVEPNLKDKVRRPWSPTRPKRKSSKSKKLDETEPGAEPGADSGGGGDIISRVASAARVAAATVLPSPSRQPGSSVSFVTERKRGGPVGGRRFEGPAASPESPEIDPTATSRRGLTDDSDSDPDDGFEFESGSGSDARPSPFSNFTARHGRGDSGRKGPTNRTLSFGADSPTLGSPAIPTSATYVKIPTAPEAGPRLDDGDESADGSEYEDAVSSDESDASPEVISPEVPLLARRLSQEEITDALLAEAASTAMRLDPTSSPARSARGERRRSTAAVTSYAEPFVNRKMRRD